VRILLLLSVLVSQIRPHLSLLAVKLAQHAHVLSSMDVILLH